MAPWSVPWLFGESGSDLPANIAPSTGGPDTAFEVFIDGALTKIYNEAGGRSKELRAIREACKKVLDGLRSEETTAKGGITTPLDPKTAASVLEPLRLACASENPKLVEPALGCLHKLVSHAYLHSESTPAGRLEDGTIVAQVVQLVSKCGEQSGEAVQLAVLRALLTIATAEHFIVHGDCLMQSVRTAFNVAIGAESDQIQRTARNALLQMLSTIVKRVTQFPLSRLVSTTSSVGQHLDRAGLLAAAAEKLKDVIPEDPREGEDAQDSGGAADESAAGSGILPASNASMPAPATVNQESPDPPSSSLESTTEAGAPPLSKDVPPEEIATEAELAPGRGEPVGQDLSEVPSPPAEGPSAQAATAAAESNEAAGVEAAGQNGGEAEQGEGEAPSGGVTARAVAALGDTRTAQLATLAEQADLRGLEKALDQIEAERGQSAEAAIHAQRSVKGLPRSESMEKERDVRRVVMRERRQAAWRHLTLPERDVLTVLSAICKMAARETGFGAVENLLHQGKLLALELLVRIFDNPLHIWNNVRPEFCEQLRQYLWPALLRNSLSPFREAFAAVTRLLASTMLQQRLRAGLKTEIGAFYPLMLLRPLEASRLDPVQLVAVLEALKSLCANGQLMVDLFVNYDCDLQASNLFERTLKGLAKVVASADSAALLPVAAGGAPSSRDKARELANETLLVLLKTLDARAEPLKALAETSITEEEERKGSKTSVPNGHSAAPPDGLATASELARFGALKEKKHSLEAGIALFNHNPVKGMAALIGSGSVASDPAAIAAFIRKHKGSLATTQIGEYFGHHEEQAIAVMHAYIDQESYAGLTIDAALRELLSGFRLPGEAQKIDRIMEKFAERYCLDNEGAFASADGPYLLAFALIMLNTDAHNPRAEKKLSSEDFVNMCQAQGESGAFAPILPRQELEAMYQRILDKEIPLPEGEGAPKQAGEAPKTGMQASRLAAAMGITQLLQPFRGASVWDKQHGVDVERAHLMARTRELVAKGQHAEHLWHTATHVEHIRPMLQVGGAAIRKALAAAMESAADADMAGPILDGFDVAIRLAGMLGLDSLSDNLLAALATCAGVESPAAPGTPAEAKQLASLSRLVALAGGPEAGYLGGGWVTVLRLLSALDLLKEELTHAGQRGNFFSANPNQVGASFTGNPHSSFSPTRTAQPPAKGPPPKAGNFGKGLLWRLGMGAENKVAEAARLQSESAQEDADDAGVPMAGEDALYYGTGAALVNWGENEGREAVERVFARSATLDGDAVVVFVRALCAVSQEELVPDAPGEPARVYSLGRLMDAAYHNLSRIRFIWGRLWAAVAPHLVSAACHPDPNVAALAVDHMRQLIAKLLARAELSHFTHQEEALRPLVAVLRHSDSSAVREQTVALIAHSITAHPRGLGSGWKSTLQVLTVAVADPAPTVVDAALDAIQAVTAALFRGVGIGMEYFPDVVHVLESAMRNPHHERLSVSAAHVMPSVARRLADAPATERQLSLARPSQSLRSGPQALRTASQEVDSPKTPAAEPEDEHPWGRIAHALSIVGRHDPRSTVADTAAAILVEIAQAHGGGWDGATWQAIWGKGFAYMLELPFPQASEGGSDPLPTGWSIEGLNRIQRHVIQHLPPLLDLLLANYSTAGPEVLQPMLSMLVRYVVQNRESMAVLGVNLLQGAIIKLAPALDPAAWQAVLRSVSLASSPDHFSPLLNGPSRASSDEVGDSRGSTVIMAPLGDPIPPAEEIRACCRSVVLMQRACDGILRQCCTVMPASAQLHLLSILQDTLLRASSFNRNAHRRMVTARLLTAHEPRGPASTAQTPRWAAGSENGAVSEAEIPRAENGVDAAEPASNGDVRHDAVGGSRIRGIDDADDAFPAAALVRQEAEGGALLVSALLRCTPTGSRPLPTQDAAVEAEKRLLGVSRRMIAQAAQQSWQGPAMAGQAEGPKPPTPDALTWDQAICAPLVEAVLGGYQQVGEEAWRSELPAIWPHLARLICSPQPSVRTALASLLQAQLPPLLHSL